MAGTVEGPHATSTVWGVDTHAGCVLVGNGELWEELAGAECILGKVKTSIDPSSLQACSYMLWRSRPRLLARLPLTQKILASHGASVSPLCLLSDGVVVVSAPSHRDGQ